MSYQKLKPCPFCGGKAHYGQAIKDIDTYTWVKWVYCTSCKAATGYAQDLSLVAGLMCYIQLSLQGIAAKVKIADSLLNPMVDADNGSDIWYTPMWFSDVWTSRRLLKKLKGANA